MRNFKIKLFVASVFPILIFTGYLSFFTYGLEYVNSNKDETYAGGIYFKNNFFVFYRDVNRIFFNQLRIVRGADVLSFECVQSERTVHNHELTCRDYARDKNSGYLRGEMIEGSDGKTFEHIKGVWSQDKNFVYTYSKRQEVINRSSFQATGWYGGVDAGNEYQATYNKGLIVTAIE